MKSTLPHINRFNAILAQARTPIWLNRLTPGRNSYQPIMFIAHYDDKKIELFRPADFIVPWRDLETMPSSAIKDSSCGSCRPLELRRPSTWFCCCISVSMTPSRKTKSFLANARYKTVFSDLFSSGYSLSWLVDQSNQFRANCHGENKSFLIIITWMSTLKLKGEQTAKDILQDWLEYTRKDARLLA